MTDPFSEQLAAWQEYVATPWGRIRYAVVEETLRRETAALGHGLRVLDVGGGDGRDSLALAAAGHAVTILDPAEPWLAEASRRAASAGVELTTVVGGLDDLDRLGALDDRSALDGVAAEGHDLVLCHFVLQYRPADAGDLARLAGMLRPGGRLSVMAPNPAGRVLRAVVTEGPAAARTELAAESAHAVTFGTDVRKLDPETVAEEAEAAGLRVLARYGTRIANDLLADDRLKADPDYFAELLALELELCDREPYCRIGGMWQLVLEKPSS